MPCAVNRNFSCGYLGVPKDYFDSSAGVAHIALLKVPGSAPKSEHLGSILVNPGGPGGSGVLMAERFGPALTKLTDGRYDIVGFDPRGIRSTRPIVNCFGSAFDYELFKAGTVLERGFDLPPDPTSDEGKQHLLDQHRRLLALQETEFKKCAETMGDELRYMGTSTVVRDIEEITRVLDGPEARINFFGASYGTILGAYLVNMLPEKIGRVIIDGVASAPLWANSHPHEWLHQWIENTEDTFQWFLRDCSEAGPKGCPLAHSLNEDPLAIQDRLMLFLDDLYRQPAAVPDALRPGVLTSGMARSVLYASTNQPTTWPVVSSIFAEALSGNLTSLYNAIITPFSSPFRLTQTDLSRAAVSCADSPPYKSEKEWPTAEFMTNKTLYNLEQSPHFGASVSLIEPDGGCQFWPASGKTPERFTGPWNATLDTPMLIISNTADPITPLASGRELNALMGPSSRLLIQNSPGHCSIGSVSACTMGHYRRYLLHGELPENEKLCEVDRGYFPGSERKEVELMSEEERELSGVGEEMALAWAELAREN
ncbi:TAP-like protein-domain-containing protein [Leucosporidium creatinivorum]|uniref:TAP-like protein-domain-containing protein n=1 Tax=Leucosporidium creatinivorum TaxID=106004 RepID=A0A1Y2G482_9BASI|nr:TAP-like protein-domain-containing protein [Leucosporidium creatinivorum]